MARWVVVAATFLSMVTACGKTPRCLVSNCSGCCDEKGQCQDGRLPAACGVGAATCTRCPAGQSCITGKCGTGTGTGGVGGTGGTAGTGGTGATGGTGGTAGTAGTGGVGGGTMAVCGPGSCGGCCDANGMCRTPNAAACGANGAACVACSGGQACVSGMCQGGGTTCNSTNCAAGCCSGSMCITPATNSACGRNGGACVACTGNQTCVGGTCTAGDCATTCLVGCCDATGSCRGGSTKDECGIGAAACQQCQLFCVLGSCLP